MSDLVPIAHIDERGEIRNIAPNVAIITSKAGSVRSSHVHPRGYHYLYVVSGQMEYIELRDGIPVAYEVHPRERVFTESGVPHRTEFPVDTVLIAVGPTCNQETHDKMTVPVEWPTP